MPEAIDVNDKLRKKQSTHLPTPQLLETSLNYYHSMYVTDCLLFLLHR